MLIRTEEEGEAAALFTLKFDEAGNVENLSKCIGCQKKELKGKTNEIIVHSSVTIVTCADYLRVFLMRRSPHLGGTEELDLAFSRQEMAIQLW